jgi:hypothetical protein
MVPAVQTPGAQSGGGGGYGDELRNVRITVDTAIVNPLQVAQEVQDYLDLLARSNGLYAV